MLTDCLFKDFAPYTRCDGFMVLLNEMPIEYSIDIKRGLSIHTCTGTIGANDLLRAINTLYSSPDYSHSYHSLWDFRDCTANLSSDEMRRIVDLEQTDQKGPGAGKVALVVGKTLDFGLARMYHMLSEQKVDRPLMVFRDYEDALKWIEEE
jgi:hypothetical protein